MSEVRWWSWKISWSF